MVAELSCRCRSIFALLVAVVAVGLAACSDGSPSLNVVVPPDTTPVVRIVAIAVTLDSAFAGVGSSVQAFATPLDATGRAITGKTASWSLDGNQALATISQTGLITALVEGISVIVATVDGVRGDGVLIIRPAAVVAQVRVALDATRVVVGGTTVVRAEVLDAFGEPIPAKQVSFTVRGSPSVATVSADGTVSALSPGGVAIVGSVNGVSGEDSLTILPSKSGSRDRRLEVRHDHCTCELCCGGRRHRPQSRTIAQMKMPVVGLSKD